MKQKLTPRLTKRDNSAGLDATERMLKEITEANGVPGHEDEVRAIMRREFKGLADKIERDKMGSIMAVKRGTSASPRVMVVGHMDEVGFMVKQITKDGYIKFLPLGGWWGHVALGQRMRIITDNGPVLGVVGSRPPHILEQKDRERVLEIKDMFIDVGAQANFDVRKKLGIKVGDPIVVDSQFTIMGNRSMYMSKAFDNRVACAIVLDILKTFNKKRHPNTLLACASVQEEIGLRGAQTLSYIAEPDICLVVDTGLGLDVPPDGFGVEERLGNGPAILIYDAGMLPNTKLRNLVIATAEKKKIPFHLAYMERGATDGGRIHISRGGVPSVVIGPPVRYIHSHNSILNRADYDSTVALLIELIQKLDAKTVQSLTEG